MSVAIDFFTSKRFIANRSNNAGKNVLDYEGNF